MVFKHLVAVPQKENKSSKLPTLPETTKYYWTIG